MVAECWPLVGVDVEAVRHVDCESANAGLQANAKMMNGMKIEGFFLF